MKKILVYLFSVAIIFTTIPLGGLIGINSSELFSIKASASTITSHKQGDIIEFGWYPQTKVTDEGIISALNTLSGDWKSYGYYSGTGNLDDGQMTSGDYIRYRDVIYGSDKYRGVVFDTYRPYWAGGNTSKSGSSNSYQDDNGYTPGTIYWFKFEPIEWRVLDPNIGMVMSETILDSQAYNNYVLHSGTDAYGNDAFWGDSSKTYYANNYANSSIRDWLNNDFYNTAFSTVQQNIIEYTVLDNSAYSDSYSSFDSETTYDKIYLLSWTDVLNANYGFSSSYNEYDKARQAHGSDYAKCQGLMVSTSDSYFGNSYWRIRSAGSSSNDTCRVEDSGYIDYYYDTSSTFKGVRPALNFNLTSEIFQSEVNDGAVYKIAGKIFNENIDYYVENTSSSNYNPNLSNMLVALSKDVYSEDDIKISYKSLGFSNPEVYDYGGNFNPASCGYTFDFKKSDYNDDKIFLITVRGSNNDSDWIGNFALATLDDEKHIGFSYPANRIYNTIKSFIESNNMTGNIKYVITGHSRGAAVANLLAVKLMENGVASSDVYNYNFACPDVACKYVFPSYNNIFNLCNRADIVPHIPGTIASSLTTPGTSWGKFGKTYWFTKDVSNINSSSTINDIKEGLKANHDCELYLEYFFDHKLNPSDWSTSSADKKFDDYFKFLGLVTKVFCPVDVVITDKYGNEMASVISGEVTYYNDCYGAILIFTDGDRKVIYINDNKKFNINLVGTDTGEMVYAVEELNLLTDEVINQKTFTDVKLEKGKTMYSPISNAHTTEDVELLLVNNDSNNNTITHTIETDGTEIKLFLSINAPKTRTIYLGDTIKLSVNSNLPNDYKIKWKVDGDGVEISPSYGGKSCKITSTLTGNVVIKACVVDSGGKIVTDENGKQISDSEYFYSEANLWLRIVYFFKKLFGISISTAQAFKDII